MRIRSNSPLPHPNFQADGGMTQNALFNQLQADLLGRLLECSKMSEITGWGAALASAIGVGLMR